jgi:prepilin-type N-terminal cleavage/methylation domain-containing protein
MESGRFRRYESLPGREGNRLGTAFDNKRDHRTDEGLTLVELLIVLVIMPMIVGAISLGLISVFSLQSSVSTRLTDTGGAQVVSSTFIKDVQGAEEISTQTTPACGSGTQLLGLEWGLNQGTGKYQTVVSYNAVGASSPYLLERQNCQLVGSTLTLTGTTMLETDLAANTVYPCLHSPSVGSACPGSTTSWTAASGVAAVTYTLNLSSPTTTLLLTATPRAWSSGSGGAGSSGQPILPLTLTGLSCPSLSVGGGAQVNVGNGSGVVAVLATCANSLVFSNGTYLNAGGIVTPPTSNQSYDGTTPGPPQTTSAGLSDPLNLNPPRG